MQAIRILQIDPSPRDVMYTVDSLREAGLEAESLRVDTAEALVTALQDLTFDIVLSSKWMPGLTAFEALEFVRELTDDVPFVVLSYEIDDEMAIELMRAGAADSVSKDDLARLHPVVVREVRDAEHRRARRSAERALLARQRMLSAAQRMAKIGSWEHDLRTNQMTLSDEIAEIMGDERQRMESFSIDTLRENIHPNDRPKFEDNAEKIRATGRSDGFEFRVIRPDGTVRWLDFHMEVESEPDGIPIRSTGVMMDITERKQAESDLRFQAHLLETVEQAVIAATIDGDMIYWNRYAEEMFGWEASEIEGKPILAFAVPDASAEKAAHIWSRVKEGNSWHGELLLQRRNGEQFWSQISNSPIYDEDGERIGVLAIAMDITERKQSDDAIRESEQKYRLLLEQAADGIVVASPTNEIIAANSRACEMFGYSLDEFLGQDLFGFFHPDEFKKNPPRVAEVATMKTVMNERTLRRSDGTFFATETSTRRLDDGRVQIIIRDITERVRADEALRRSEREYRNLFESASDAIIIFDPSSDEIVDVNRQASKAFGVGGESLVGERLGNLIGENSLNRLKWGVQSESQGVEGVEAVINRPDGSQAHLVINASLVDFRNRELVMSIHRDITSQKELERQLAHQALHDDLTGLANRVLFENRLEHALVLARENSEDVAAMMLDLDRFKLINETLGHDVGDRLLISVAERLAQSVNQGDTIARFGGDEFAILVENVGSVREVTLVAEWINNILQLPIELDGHEIVVTSSIGIVFGKSGNATVDEMLRSVDVAMYRAKDEGRGQFVVFDSSMDERMFERLKLETDFRQALTRDELRVYFQPTVELSSGDITGMEALVRWMHPVRGLIPPIEFIPLAEETGLIRLLDLYVFQAACRQLACWQKRFKDQRSIMLSVNLSAQGFQHPDLVHDVSMAIEETGVDPSNIQIELTESVIMTDADSASARLRQLKSLGLRLAIDDFGTGYSSLSYLKRFPVDVLKVDKSFVDGFGIDPEDTAIVEAVLSLGRALGLKIIAEGIESEGTVQSLLEIGCLLGQGYHYSRPLPADAFENLWANGLRIKPDWDKIRAS